MDKILSINIRSAVNLVREATPHMRPGGSIVIISSYTAFNPAPPIALYAVSKTALLGLTKALADELAPDLRVNCVAPGIVPTKFSAALVASAELEEASAASTLLKRLGRPEDIAAAAAFLASVDASYITGETVVVAGGMQSRL
jgi:dehydrogenase/reductase SDR family member 4